MVKLTQERVRELFVYEPTTGIFTLREANRLRPAGAVCGCVRHDGYIQLNVDNKSRAAHRVAWLYMTGEWPPHDIDHIDGDRQNNAIANLRHVSRSINLQNQRRCTRGNTGHLGVYVNPRLRKKFCAQISANGTHKYLGAYATPDEAHQAYVEAKRVMHAGCTI